MKKEYFGQAVNKALDNALQDKKVILLGEDICDPYGGAFKVTKGLSTKYPDQVINTPMSEAALTGVCAGLALRGFKPILEIMFGDFITLCADQIVNHASKFRFMYGVDCPMIIRTPMGGRKGYGPTHSQTLEHMFLGVPGLRIIAPSIYHDVDYLLQEALKSPDPVLWIENKSMYSMKMDVREMTENGKIIFNEKSFFTTHTYGGVAPLIIKRYQSSAVIVHSDITNACHDWKHEWTFEHIPCDIEGEKRAIPWS